MPEVIQVTPKDNYEVEVLFHDGKLVCFDVKPLLNKGVFKILSDKDFFINRCTVINHTLAWDITGNYDAQKCLDVDPEILYQLDSYSELIETKNI